MYLIGSNSGNDGAAASGTLGTRGRCGGVSRMQQEIHHRCQEGESSRTGLICVRMCVCVWGGGGCVCVCGGGGGGVFCLDKAL